MLARLVSFFNQLKEKYMKHSRDQHTKQNKQNVSHMPKPEIRDNLDSRKNEEQSFKGDDMNNNKKEVQSEGKKKKK